MHSISKHATAYHEAGHAVVALKLGFKIKSVTIVPQGETAGSVTWRKPLRFSYNSGVTGESMGHWHNRIASTFAGREAQRRFRPRSIRNHQMANDYDGVGSLLLHLHTQEKERSLASAYLQERTRNLVHLHWRQIQDLAKALLERQTLSGEEVRKLLNASQRTQRLEAGWPE